MKTLDEVIDYCEGKQTCGEWVGIADALHYLKKLKRIEAKIEKIAIGNVEDTLSKMDNPPLTWEELKQMKGEPVWIVWDDGIWGQHWILIHRIDNFILSFIPLNDAITNYDGYLRKIDLGRTWNIYKEEIK